MLPPAVLANICDFLEYPEAIRVIKQQPHGFITILPYLQSAHSRLSVINPYNITRCQQLRCLSLPNSDHLNNQMLTMLPKLEQLTVRSDAQITNQIWSRLPNLQRLELLPYRARQTNCMPNGAQLAPLTKLELLWVPGQQITVRDLVRLPSLKTLILERSPLSPVILNHLPRLEFCLLNGQLIKYHSSLKNKALLHKITQLRPIEIKIYALD